MKNKLRIALISTGTVLILSALFLCLYNISENKRAYRESESTLAQLKSFIPEPVITTITLTTTEPDLYAQYETVTTAVPENITIDLDGTLYCGYLSLPSLGIELPVANEFSYPALKTSPCLYSGTVAGEDLVIAAHNYNSHFGRIKELTNGDEIIFTDCSGIKNNYTVISSESIDGTDISSMLNGNGTDWQLTLFTCDLSGKARITIRAELKK